MTDIIEKYTSFGKIKHVWQNNFDLSGLHEFLSNVVMNSNNFDENNKCGYGIMLKDFSDIYVLVAHSNFPFDKLSQQQKRNIDFDFAKRNFILGYFWLCPWNLQSDNHIPYHFIQYIDTRISGLNIARYMIDKYENIDEAKYLFPYEIVLSSKYYWKKYFTDIYDVDNKNELEKMIHEFDLKTHIKWNDLLEIL